VSRPALVWLGLNRITPAASLGALLWQSSRTFPFLIASGFGLVGAFVFGATVDETAASRMMR
jgi:hypothetical protein